MLQKSNNESYNVTNADYLQNTALADILLKKRL